MKSNLMRIAGALAVLVCIFLAFSCGEAPKNTQVSNATANSADGLRDSCPKGNVDEKISQLTTKIKDKLPDKIKGHQGVYFDFQLRKFSQMNRIEMLIRGKFSGKQDGKGSSTFEDFWDQIDDYLEEGCIVRVRTVSGTPGTDWPEVAAYRSDGFEWSLCESPNVYCANGYCKPESECGLGNANIPMNVNQNSNSNSNSNSNTNSNSNSNTNNRGG